MGMLVLRERRARVDVHPRMRHAIRVHEPGTKTGKNLTNLQSIEVNERHPHTVPQVNA
jgi:hypothetical protein